VVKNSIDLANINDRFLLRGILENRLKQYMDRGQISQIYKSIAVKAELDQKEISGHLKRVGAAQGLLDSGKTIG
jgi:site-specific recombinase XerD